MSDLAQLIGDEVTRMPGEPDAATLTFMLDKMTAIQNAADEAVKRVKAAMLESIIRTGQPIVVGDIKYYAGIKKTTKCVDVRAALLLFLKKHDIATLEDCLASGAFKHGECRKRLDPKHYAALFVETEAGELKEGKPPKVLLLINEKFNK
jgi:hypothetical protein